MQVPAPLTFGHTRTEEVSPDQFERHCHTRCELLFVVQGQGQYVAEDTRYPLLPGSLCFFGPGRFHFVQPEQGVPYERYVVNFPAEMLPDAIAALPVPGGREESRCRYFAPGVLPPAVASVFSLWEEGLSLCGEGTAGEERATALSVAALTQILLFLTPALPAAEREGQACSPLVSRVMAYVNDHLSEPPDLGRLAALGPVSVSYLCRLFRRETGVTVGRYLTEKRMLRARSLLHRGVPPTRVAMEVGYTDYSAFYRAFVAYTGHGPARSSEAPASALLSGPSDAAPFV